MNRGNQILVAILVVQVALAVLLFWPRQPASLAGDPLLAGLEMDKVEQITIGDGAGEVLLLARAGSAWVLADADDYPVTDGAVSDLLDKVAALRTGRPVAETEESQARLKVADDQYVSRVELRLDDGTVETLYVGTAPSYGASHVRMAGQKEVYLASDLSSEDVSTRLSSWIDTLYFDLAGQEILAATLDNQNGHLEFVKEGEEWTMVGLSEDETASSNSISSLVTRASSLRMLRPLGIESKPEYGMQDPSAVLVIRARGEEGTESTYTLHVGAQADEDKSYVLKSSESPYYVRVAEYTAQDWVEKARQDLLELPETPEAGSE